MILFDSQSLKGHVIIRLAVAKAASSAFFLYPVYTIFLFSRGQTMFDIMRLESILAFTVLVCEIPSGVFADKFGRHRAIAFGFLMEFAATVPMIWVEGFISFLPLFILSGISVSLLSGAIEAYLQDAVGERGDLAKSVGFLGMFESAGLLIGVMLGAIIVAVRPDSYIVCLVLVAVAHFCATVLAFTLPAIRVGTGPDRLSISALQTVLLGGRAVFTSYRVWLLVLFFTMISGLCEIHYLWQPFAVKCGLPQHMLGFIGVGLCLAMMGAGYLVRFHVQIGTEYFVLIASILSVMGFVSMSLLPGTIIGVLSLIVLVIASEALRPIFVHLLSNQLPAPVRSTAMSFVFMFTNLISMIMRPGIGLLADRSIAYPFIFSAVLATIGVILLPFIWPFLASTSMTLFDSE